MINIKLKVSAIVFAASATFLADGALALNGDSSPASQQPQSGALEEILVTAQRRSENAQDIPMSISAFNGETLENRGIVSTEDLSKITPGLQFGSASLARNELFIRGIGSNRFEAGGESSSAVFIDDIYQPRFSNLLFNLLDVDRIEVLKGPHGTLYGRNTIGGAIAVYTPTPSEQPHVEARADAGTQNLYGGMVSVAGPLSDQVTGSMSVGYRRRDGFMKDLVSGKTNGTESSGARLKLVYAPTDQLKFTFTASTFDTTEDAVLLARGTPYVYLLNPAIPPPGPNPDPYNSAYSTPGGASTQTRLVSARADYQTDDLTLSSITAYQHTHDENAEDGDSSIYDAFNYQGSDDSHTISQEFRVSSNNSGALSAGGRLKWLGGLYFLQDRVTEPYGFRIGSDSLFAALAGPLFPAAGIVNNVYKDLTTKSSAAFGQATYSISDRLDITAGARYSYDQKKVLSTGETNLPGFPLVTADFAVPASKSWGKFTPKITVDYKAADQTMLYATWAEGYKSGAPQSVPFDPRLAAQLVNPETVNGIEVGVKSEFLDHRVRVNAALFDNKFKDLQVRTIQDLGGGVAEPTIENAASSTIRGAEFEATWVITDGLSVDLGYNYLDASYGRFIANPIPGSFQDLSGNRMPRAPRNAASLSARYDIPLPGDRKLSFSVLTNYTSLQFFQPDDTPAVAQGGYGTTDFSVTYAFSGDHLQLTGWVKNAFDREFEVYAEEDAPSVREGWGDKRSAGVSLRYRL
jgi:iron complex outermembrane recepter protein